MDQFVAILRGAPASGKTTIAKSFRDYQQKIVWLKVDSFKDFFGEEGAGALEWVNELAVENLSLLLDKNFSVVMEGVFQDPSCVGKAAQIAEQKKVPVKIFELKTSLSTLFDRDQSREGIKEGCRKPFERSSLEKIFNTLKNTPISNAIELDTEKNNLNQCKAFIWQSFKE